MTDGSDLNETDDHGQTMLMHAVICGAGAAVVRQLVAAGAVIRACDEDGCTRTDLAILWHDAGVMAALLTAGAGDTANVAASLGLSELHCAALRGSAS